MPEKQESMNTESSENKQSSLKDLRDIAEREVEDMKEQEKQRRIQASKPKFPGNTKTEEATIFEVELTMNILTKKTEMVPLTKPVKTSEKVIDLNNQIFNAGTATIVLIRDQYGAPVERVQGLEAEEVELLLKLFGLANDERDDQEKD